MNALNIKILNLNVQLGLKKKILQKKNDDDASSSTIKTRADHTDRERDCLGHWNLSLRNHFPNLRRNEALKFSTSQ